MKSVIIISIAVVFLFVPQNVFAVDFVDSSGYTPSWAIGTGYHTVLVKCTQVAGDLSSDSYWCLEWMAYVLDQGIENFPESTSEVSSNAKVNPDDLVKGELYFGSLKKYLPPDSSYEKSWVVGAPFAITEKHVTQYATAGVHDQVAQGIFVSDIYDNNGVLTAIVILEFENKIKANELFDIKSAENQNKINSQNTMEDIYAGKNIYFENCYGYLKNYDLPDESALVNCILDKYVVSISSNQLGGYVTDSSFDYVLPDEVVNDISRKIGKNINDTFQTVIDSQMGGITISDEKSCIALIEGATIGDAGGCIAKFLNIDSGEILTISKGVDLYNSKGIFKNSGTINVLGAITNWGSFTNFETINVSGQIVIHGTLINKGAIMIENDASIVVSDDGTLDNFGSIINNDDLINFGIINNHCDGVILGEPIGNDFGFGDEPIKQIPCGTIPEKVEPKITPTITPEVKTTTEPEIISNPESSGGGCLIATATFGSELAPQVQQLREIRDNSLLQTESGSAFIESFNQFYYSFSPEIADLERENPVFKEAVKITITPMLSSLSILNYVDMDSEIEVLGYGISLILLNVGMYFVLPAIVIHRIRKFA